MKILGALLLVMLSACEYFPIGVTGLYETAMVSALDLVVHGDSVEADGASTLTMSVTVSPFDPNAGRNVTLRSTRGRLERGRDAGEVAHVTLDEEGHAVERLVAPTSAGTALLSAQYGRLVELDSVTFVRARPGRIVLDADGFALAATPASHVTLTASLLREQGRVTEQPEIVWSLDQPVGAFAGRTWSSGSESIKFTAGPTDYRGPLTITVTTQGDQGADISASVTLWITDPQ